MNQENQGDRFLNFTTCYLQKRKMGKNAERADSPAMVLP